MKGISESLKKPFLKIKKKYQNFFNEISLYNHTHKNSKYIFWCWLQNKENAPILYKSTLNSLYRNAKNHTIIIINNTNIKNFIKIPTYILEKYKKKYISNAHFSDILRLELLIKFGGTWIDSSVLLTKYNYKIFKQDLFFFRNPFNNSIIGSNWFISSEKSSPVLKTTRDLIYEHWRINNKSINYFIFHIFLTFSFNRYFKDYTNIPYYSFIEVHYLFTELIKRYNRLKYKIILKVSDIHKLTIKIGNRTRTNFIAKIINEYF